MHTTSAKVKDDEKKNKNMMKHLMHPVKTRQKAKKTIKQELDDHIANYPQSAKELPGMRRKKDREHDIVFLKNVVQALKIKDDPIQIATKEIKEKSGSIITAENQKNPVQSNNDNGDDDSESEADDSTEGRGSVNSDASSQYSDYSYAGVDKLNIDPTYYESQIATRRQTKKTPWEWAARNISMQIFADEEKKHKLSLQKLGIRLNKFISKRNISFNTKLVFIHWKKETDEWNNMTASTTRTIGNMRKFVKEKTNDGKQDGQETSASGPTTADSEGKETNEAQETNQNDPAGKKGPGGKNSRDTRFKSKEREDEDDKDIKEADQYTRSHLIPNAFGVYNPN